MFRTLILVSISIFFIMLNSSTFASKYRVFNLDESGVRNFKLPKPTENQMERKLSLWATYYYTPVYSYSSSQKHSLLDRNGKRLGPTLNQRNWCMAALEGSVCIKYKSGEIKTFNYDGYGDWMQVDCSPYYSYTKSGRLRFRRAKGPYGDGADETDYILFPYRTVAVDSRVIPYGTVLYIPAARGVTIKLKTGRTFIHDGYFFAADKGGAIKNTHIDVFLGVEKIKSFSHFIKSNPKYTFSAYVIDNPKLEDLLDEAHLPGSDILKSGDF